MKRLGIGAKIWLSVAVFIFGYVVSVALGQVQSVRTEDGMRATAQALFPAAQRSQEAESSFERMTKSFSDAVMTEDTATLEAAQGQAEAVSQALRSIGGLKGLPRERSEKAVALASSVSSLGNEARSTYGSMIGSGGNLTEQMQQQSRQLAERMDKMRQTLRNTREEFSSDLKNELESAAKRSAQQRGVALGVFVFTVLLASVVVNLTVRRSVTGPIVRAVQGVRGAAGEAAKVSAQMSASGDLVAQGAAEQASYLQETAASLEEISTMTRQNADRAASADKLMRDAKKMVDQATEAMNQLTSSMSEISRASKEVSGVLKSIDEIAFHTNILALNAAVEAARAGDSGAGFSVVADEVRALAQRSAEAAKNSSALIEETLHKVQGGVELVSATSGAFFSIASAVARGSQVMTDIASANEQQSQGIREIGDAMARMDKVTQQNSGNAHETAEAASVMSQQVEVTRDHIDGLVAVLGLKNA